MHCISLAILSGLSRFPAPAVGTNWPWCVNVPLKTNQPINQYKKFAGVALRHLFIMYAHHIDIMLINVNLLVMLLCRCTLWHICLAVRWRSLWLFDNSLQHYSVLFSVNFPCLLEIQIISSLRPLLTKYQQRTGEITTHCVYYLTIYWKLLVLSVLYMS